jgi:hypothetical protein
MKIYIRNPRDFYSGLIFLAVGATFALVARGDPFGILPGYPMGNTSRMGPGYFPFVLATILALLGLLITLMSLRTEGKPVEKFAVRGLFFVLGAVVAFGLLAGKLGIVLSLILLVMIGAFGGAEFRFREVLISAIILSASCVLIFVYGLKLPFPIWPVFPG